MDDSMEALMRMVSKLGQELQDAIKGEKLIKERSDGLE